MKAILVDETSPERALRWAEVPDPVPGPGEVLVDIHATAVNRADLLQRAGNYPPPPGAPSYLGLEMAGVVAGLGPGVTGWQVGERVCALLAGGGYAERIAVPAPLLVRLPADWDFVKAAAFPEVFYTAFVNLFMEAQLQAGESVLIHGGASGVGTAAIQLARAEGCRVAVTAGSPEKRRRSLELGAELAVDYREEDFAAAVQERLGGVDVILDISGGAYLERNLKALKLKGRLVLIALLGGPTAPIDLGLVLRKRLRLIGSLLRSRSLEEKTRIVEGFAIRFWPRMAAGRIAPVIETALPITRAAEAHQLLAENRNIGKVVLVVRQ
ncbi:MAG: NAD(P)H-quinone oxidoreductase [Candidatus Latescibacteria bacterium]|nr:NAD(P)H-quinone oxidoreductase [Candidatus Latescibacterota bacterium]